MKQTSLTAYKENITSFNEKETLVLNFFKKYRVLSFSDMEIAQALALNIRSVSPRRNELVKKGLIFAFKKKICPVTKQKVIAWKYNPAVSIGTVKT